MRRNRRRASVPEKRRSTFARRHDPAGRVMGIPGDGVSDIRMPTGEEDTARGGEIHDGKR